MLSVRTPKILYVQLFVLTLKSELSRLGTVTHKLKEETPEHMTQ